MSESMHGSVLPPFLSLAQFVFKLSAILLSTNSLCFADTLYTDQNKLFKSARNVGPLGASLFGDKVNLYTGALEFVQTDVVLPGNNRLPVSVGRRLIAGQDPKNGLFGAWDLEIPHLHGVFSLFRGWASSSGNVGARCTGFGAPPQESGSYGSISKWNATEFWHGNFLYIPGIGDQELLTRSSTNVIAPSSGSYPVVTRNNWQIRCLSAMDPANGSTGEAFVAVSPEGIEYRFDWMVSRQLPILTKSSWMPEALGTSLSSGDGLSLRIEPGEEPMINADSNGLARAEVWILPTRISDRFGNSVNYVYDTANKWQLKSITANDGSGTPRTITFSYIAPGSIESNLVRSISDGTRTWTYRYGGTNGRGPLQSVTLPDNSAWQLEGLSSLTNGIQYLGDGDCDQPGMVNDFPLSGTATHPSGATGEFLLKPVRHGRVGVPNSCIHYVDLNVYRANYPKEFDTFSLAKKVITGPGLPRMEWSTSFSAPVSGWAPWNGQQGTKQVDVTNPDGHITRHTFGTAYLENEGQLQSVENIDRSVGGLRTTLTRYAQPIPPRGKSEQKRGDGEMAARVYEIDRREISQQGTSFLWTADSFNDFAQPTQVTKASSQGTSRTERLTYNNNTSAWVLGQLATLTDTNTNTQVLENAYDGTANLMSVKRFTLPEKSFTYDADGNILTEKDGLQQETKYTNYRRGVPQNITFADGKTTSAVVNNLGGLDSVTDPTGATTIFGYDAMGRFASISYPGGDPVNWNPTTLSFEQISSSEFDLTPGHWRQTITTGGSLETNYFDAFWRPVYSERWDKNDQASTQRIVKHQYDFDGRTTFDSYPVRTHGQIGHGVRRHYDALGRLVLTETDSELGLLRSSVWYDPSAFKTVKTDALNRSTTYEFQVFDQPSEDVIKTIRAPEEVTVDIERDLFEKTLSITRSGQGKSLARSYAYDTFHRLIKTTEPETGVTLQSYDAAGNVVCRAAGRSLISVSTCGEAPLAKRTQFDYDARNRLKTTTYGDGSPAIGRTYTGDGLLETISSGGSLWTYGYNKRRLNTSETLSYGGATYRIGRSYNASGSLMRLEYPFNLTIDYDPNALGEARKIGVYATNIRYHPNGGVAGFTYGNGINHSVAQYPRGMPERVTDAGVLDEQYRYDANGNVKQITDELQNVAGRTMDYDGLDRLSTVSAPGLWGTASYGYDAIDNLVSTSISGGANARTLRHNILPETNRLGSITDGPAHFNLNYAYDDQGNVTQRGAQSYTFDQANRMTVATGRATYHYDGLGRRVSSVGTDGVNKIQIYTQDGKLLYSGSSGSSGTKYIYLNNHVIAEVK